MDSQNMTAGDYTINFTLHDDQYTFFLENYFDETNPIPLLLQLKLFLQGQIDEKLDKLNAILNPDIKDRVDPLKLKVALIEYSFDNGDLI